MSLEIYAAETLDDEKLFVIRLMDCDGTDTITLVSETDEVREGKQACKLAIERLKLVIKAFDSLAKEDQIAQIEVQDKISLWLKEQIEKTYVN